jgi:hypothetical protein
MKKTCEEETFNRISSDLAKLTLNPEIPSNAIKSHFKVLTILALTLRKIKVSSAY